MAKPIQYCKVISLQLKLKKKYAQTSTHDCITTNHPSVKKMKKEISFS